MGLRRELASGSERQDGGGSGGRWGRCCVSDATLDSVRADTLRLEKGTLPFSEVEKGSVPFSTPPVADSVVDEVYGFMMERLRAWYLEGTAGITTEMFDAVLDLRPVSPLDFDDRLRALVAFLALPEAASLTAANKRIGNILRKSGEQAGLRVDQSLLTDPAERQLATALDALREEIEGTIAGRRYGDAMRRLATLRPVVDTFFDRVMVMAEDPAVRANRLALLAALQRLFQHTANLSRLPG